MSSNLSGPGAPTGAPIPLDSPSVTPNAASSEPANQITDIDKKVADLEQGCLSSNEELKPKTESLSGRQVSNISPEVNSAPATQITDINKIVADFEQRCLSSIEELKPKTESLSEGQVSNISPEVKESNLKNAARLYVIAGRLAINNPNTPMEEKLNIIKTDVLSALLDAEPNRAIYLIRDAQKELDIERNETMKKQESNQGAGSSGGSQAASGHSSSGVDLTDLILFDLILNDGRGTDAAVDLAFGATQGAVTLTADTAAGLENLVRGGTTDTSSKVDQFGKKAIGKKPANQPGSGSGKTGSGSQGSVEEQQGSVEEQYARNGSVFPMRWAANAIRGGASGSGGSGSGGSGSGVSGSGGGGSGGGAGS